MPSPSTGRVSPSAAAIARPFLVLLPILTFLIPSLFLAYSSTPTHTSEARLLVGGFDPQDQAVPGFVAATESLASTYARLVGTPAVVDEVAKTLDLDPAQVRGHVHASPVPDSSLIRVEGTADNRRDATRFADAGADALQKYATGAAGTTTAADLLGDFQAASADLASATATLNRVNRALEANPNDSSLLSQQATSQAAVDAAKLKADALGERYSTFLENTGGSANVQLVSPASYQGDDRQSMVQLGVAASVGLGLVVGIALATLVVNQEANRARSRS
jgi:capsular polysaccharide biosynthesis protein